MKWTKPLLMCAFLAACGPNVETRGALKDPDWKSQLTVGTSTREDVMNVLGSPSAKADFGPETWYYITLTRESTAFFKPDVTQQDITRFTFDTDGTLKAIDSFDKSQAKDFETVNRITPTEGHQMTFMEQLLGNLGRFNSPGSTPGASSGNRRGPGGAR